MEDALALSIRGQEKVWRTTEEQRISTQVWRIPWVKININVLRERLEEDVRVYAQEECFIPAGMGKYIPVLTNPGIAVTVTGLILLEIVYNVKKKLGCIEERTDDRATDIMRSEVS